jgi:hypothetical protein
VILSHFSFSLLSSGRKKKKKKRRRRRRRRRRYGIEIDPSETVSFLISQNK